MKTLILGFSLLLISKFGCTQTPLPSSITCDNWLSLPIYPGYVDVGDLDISGNKITIEALVNRTEPYDPGTQDGNEGDIVSKHWDPGTVNYLLRLNHVYITTNNGFYGTGDPCPIELNKTYHVALVYDGSTLKYYRNGFVMAQVNATGNLVQNNFPTRIGLYSGAVVENMLGYINEVRIWNVARTQDEIRQYIGTSIPSPATQPGLLAYYTFDNLLNKQGNTAWNGTLFGNASINATNSNCILSLDSCEQIVPIYLSKFEGKLLENGTKKLTWVTDQEINSDHFDVYRKIGNKDFELIASVPSYNQPTSSSYGFLDSKYGYGENWMYKLKMIDKDGGFKWSNTISIKSPLKEHLLIVFPNPAKDFIYFKFKNPAEPKKYRILSSAGHEMSVGNINQSTSPYQINISALPKGIYFIEVRVNDQIFREKFVKG